MDRYRYRYTCQCDKIVLSGALAEIPLFRQTSDSFVLSAKFIKHMKLASQSITGVE